MSQPSQQSPQGSPQQPSHQLPQQQPHQGSQQSPHYPPQYTPYSYPPSSYPPGNYNAPQSVGSPYASAIPPPLKRPRLSPNPQSPYSSQSPYNSPSLANIQLPNQVFSSPYYGAQVNGGAPSNNNNFYNNTMNNAPPTSAPPSTMPNQAGTMGPPSRPNDKPTDMNELTDVLLGSGIDLREEEAALMNRRIATQQTSTITPPIDFNHWSNNIPGGQSSFYGGGTFNQPAVSLQSEEERAKAATELKVRRRAERAQFHLNQPFLQTGPLERRLRQGHNKEQIPYFTKGIIEPPPESRPREIIVAGPDNNEFHAVIKDQNLLELNTNITDVLALLSLACEERICRMVEDVATVAQNRYSSAQGFVPPDLQDIATGEGEPQTVSAPSESDMSISSKPLKRSYASMNPSTPLVLDGVFLPTTVKYSNQLVEQMHAAAVAEREAHIDMLWNRYKREAAKAAKEASEAASASPSGAGQVAPEVEPKKGGLKKEQRKQAEAKASEAQQAAATNQTMQLAMSKKKGPSWLTGGGKGGSASSTPSRPGTSFSRNAPKSRADIASSLPPVRKWGQFQEKKTMDMRDIIHVLEQDRTAKAVLGRAYMRRNSPGGMAKGWWAG